MTKADYAVIGDLHQVLPALIDAIKARSGALSYPAAPIAAVAEAAVR